MHTPRPPSGLSVFELQGRLLRSIAAPTQPKTRFRRDALLKLTPAVVSQARDVLTEAAALGPLFLGTSHSAWAGAALTDGHAVQAAVDLAGGLSEEVPATRARIAAVLSPVHTAEAVNVAEAASLLGVARDAGQVLATFKPDLFNHHLHELLESLAPAGRGWFASLWATFTSARYRRAKEVVRSNTNTTTGAGDMLAPLAEAAKVADAWRAAKFDTPAPVQVEGAADALKAAESL
jgi:hypothetical protein